MELNNVQDAVKAGSKLIKWVVVAIIGLVLFNASFDTVPVNHVGIVFNKVNGGVNDKPIKPGWRFHLPFVEDVYTVSTYTHALHLKPGVDVNGVGFDDTITTQTKDGQYLTTQAEVHYRILPDSAMAFFQRYRTVENLRSKMPSIIQRAVERVTGTYDIVELLGTKRVEAQTKIEDSVRDELVKYDITLESFTLVDTDAGDAIEQALAEEAVAQQAIQTAKQKQEQQKVINQTELEKASAEADRKKIQAEADAEVKRIQAEAEAEANTKLARSVTPELTKYLEAQARMQHGWVTIQGISDMMIQQPQPTE